MVWSHMGWFANEFHELSSDQKKTIDESQKRRCSRQAIYQFVFYTLLLSRKQMLNDGNNDRIFASPLSYQETHYITKQKDHNRTVGVF